MTAQEHANAIWRAEPSPEALAGAISAYTDELRGEILTLTAENAALREWRNEAEGKLIECGKTISDAHDENAALKEVIYGKDPSSEDPCDWGLKDQLQGAYSQRDANRDALHQARARIAELESELLAVHGQHEVAMEHAKWGIEECEKMRQERDALQIKVSEITNAKRPTRQSVKRRYYKGGSACALSTQAPSK